jgi:hypothetical protein
VDINNKDRLKVSALLKEYEILRADARTNWVLWVISVALSILIFVAILIVSISSNQYLLLLFSPALSLFFAMIALSLLGLLINSGIRLNKIEDSLNKILDEKLMEWELIGGVWFGVHRNVIISNVTRYVTTISFSSIAVGVAPIIVGLILGLNSFYLDGRDWFERNNLLWLHGIILWLVPILYIAVCAWTLRLGIGLGIKRHWENMKVDLDLTD